MASPLLTTPGPLPTQATPALDAVRASAAPVVPAGKPSSGGRSFADELTKPSAKPAPGVLSSDAEASSSESAKRAVQVLKKPAPGANADLERSPAVALLTGRLDKVPASQIAPLVTGNKFINDALSSEDIPEYLNKPAAVADLVKDLGLPPQVLQQAQAMGLDVTQKMAPNDLLKALGIDAQRVGIELSQLKANLPLEGLTPYINRAQALNPRGVDPAAANPLTLGKPQLQAQPKPDQVLTPADDLNLIGFAWLPNSDRPVLPEPQQAPQTAQPLDLNSQLVTTAPEDNQPQDLSPQALMAALQGMPRTQRPAVDMLKSTSAAPGDERLTLAAAFVNTAKNGSDDALEALVARANPDGSLDILTMQDIPEARAGQAPVASPKMNKASFDAFAQLGEKMRAADTLVLGDPAPQRPLLQDSLLNEQILSRSLMGQTGEVVNPFMQPRPDGQSLMMQVKTTEVTTLLPMSNAAAARLDILDQKALMRDLLQGQAAPASFNVSQGDGLQTDSLMSKLQLQPQEELRLQSPLLAGLSQTKGRDSSGGEQPKRDQDEHNEPGKGLRELGLGLHQNQNHNLAHTMTGDSFATQATAVAEPLNVQARLDLMQKVVNHATMLAKQGGGTVRLDLSSPEFGPLELALNMNKDKIDLRVLAGSDKARDAIMADLTQLKGALAVQNVLLGKVEVGVGGRPPQPQQQQNFAGMNQQQNKQPGDGRAQDSWRAQERDGQNGRITPAARPRMPLAMLQNQAIDNGRIAVRA